MSFPRAIRNNLGPGAPHNHKNGSDHCLVCQQHDLDAHKRARDGKRSTDCPKCRAIVAAIEGSALPVVPDHKIEQAQKIAKRILGEQ